MTVVVSIILVVALALISGCTPLGEKLARKSGSEADESRGVGHMVAAAHAVSSYVDQAAREILARYGATIKQSAQEYGFDWRMILAVMRQESCFLPDARSEKGAFGLMQLMPVTGAEVARALALEDLSRATENIRAGVYYLRRLYNLFTEVSDAADRLKLALASYNAGPGRVLDAQSLAAYLQNNPGCWQSVREALPLLARRYEMLHRTVWPISQRPRRGWFSASKQTIAYVDAVVKNYEEYVREFH